MHKMLGYAFTATEICSLSGINNPHLNTKDYYIPWIHLVSLLHRIIKGIFSTVSVDEFKCLAVQVMAQDSSPFQKKNDG